MTNQPVIGVIGITPRMGRAISDEIDSCETLLKAKGIEPLSHDIQTGYGKITVEFSQLGQAIGTLKAGGFEASEF